jgi:hypothetical protein
MSRLRTDFYNDPAVAADAATADKDALARDFVGMADTRLPDNFSGLTSRPLAYGLQNHAVAGCFRRQGLTYLATRSPFPNNAGHPLYHSRNCDTGGVCLQKEHLCKRLY